jgi:hypothetical protein
MANHDPVGPRGTVMVVAVVVVAKSYRFTHKSNPVPRSRLSLSGTVQHCRGRWRPKCSRSLGINISSRFILGVALLRCHNTAVSVAAGERRIH